jgi:hypothetical protein
MPSYTFDDRSGRYRADNSGQYVARRTVHQWTLATTNAAGRDMRQQTQQLRDGQTSVAEWQANMAANIKAAHLAAAAAAVGGREHMTFAMYGNVGAVIKREYAYLRDFANGMADGSIPLDGRVLVRAAQYMQDARETYAVFERERMMRSGYDEEQSIRTAQDSCAGCIEATDAGWVDIGTLPPPGSRDCMANCECFLNYRRSATGEEAA